MEQIIHVRPYNKRDDTIYNGLVTSVKYADPIESDGIRIPIPKGLDVNQILMENTDKVNHEDEGEDLDMDEDVVNFVSIEDLSVSNFKQQISLVVFRDFKVLEDKYIEKIFNSVLESYKWSKLQTDTITLFLQVETLKDLKMIYNNQDIFESLCSKVTVNLHEVDLEPVPLKEISKVKITNVINSALRSKNKQQNINNKEVYYDTSYKVDANELIEVPNSMKETIVKELIQFRSSMLTKERKKRDREIDNERIKSKKILSQLFAKETTQEVEESAIPEPEMEKPEMNDDEYNNYLESLAKQLLDSNYSLHLSKLESLKLKNAKLKRKLATLKNYENDLIENKFKYIDDIKDYKCSSYSEYWEKRSKIKQDEEEKDEIDRKEEQDELANKQTPNIMKQQSEEATPEKEANFSTNEPLTSIKIPDITVLNATQLEQVKSSIELLVENFIGVKEQELIDFIYTSLLEKTLTIEELTETFDEDAINLIQNINKLVENF